MSYFLTTQTGFSSVPLDCLQEIFQYLENDMKSLYRCMLVNRTWCRINIALLWRRPFEYSETTRKYPELIRTYITCLPKSSKDNICKAGYNIHLHPRPLFPYHRYLKELDCEKLDIAIEEWDERFGFDKYRPETMENVVYSELLRLLLSRCEGLWDLRLGQYRDKYGFPRATEFPLIKSTLTNLRKFEFNGDLDCLDEKGLDNLYEFLKRLSNISNNLEYINIDMTEDDESYSGDGLRRLIKSQKNLSFFRYDHEHSAIEKTKEFVKALSHNASTLKNIEFSGTAFNVQCLSSLKKFNNLESMQFVYCYEKDISSEIEEIVEHSPSQLEVKKLMFHKGLLTSVTLEILRLANISVRELTVDNVVPGLFEHIYEHCPNITYFATVISQKTVESLEYLSASKIEHLILKTLDSKDNNNTHLDMKDFQQIGKNLSLNLYHLSLDLNISVEEFSFLLKECQSPLESLCLKFDIKTVDDLNKDEYLKAVIEFAKKDDSLKEFRFRFSPEMLEKDPSKLSELLNNKRFEDIEAEDIFSKDILAEAKLLIPNILRETQEPFAHIGLNPKGLCRIYL
jgi:hypothetical protein